MWLLFGFTGFLTALAVVFVVAPLMKKPSKGDRALAFFLTAVIPLASIFFYMLLGAPDLPGL